VVQTIALNLPVRHCSIHKDQFLQYAESVAHSATSASRTTATGMHGSS
jgi:hypothetical protein